MAENNLVNTTWNSHESLDEDVFKGVKKKEFSISKGSIRIESILLERQGRDIRAYIVLVNGMPNKLMIRMTPFLLLDNNKVIGEVSVDFKDRVFPPFSSTPLVITITNDKININDINNWSIVFKYYYGKTKLDSSFVKKVSKEQQKEIVDAINELPKLKFNEIRLHGNQCKLDQNGNILIQILLGSGYSKRVSLHRLPIKLDDALGDLIAAITFNIQGVSVEPQSWKVINLVIPKNKLLRDNPDLSTWKIELFRPIPTIKKLQKTPLQ